MLTKNNTKRSYKIFKFLLLSLDPRPHDQSQEKIKTALRQAFKIWSEHSMLTFTETKKHDDADIRISFQKSKHDLDPYVLDSTTLAHAFQPGTGVHGDAHFKMEMEWDFDALAGDLAVDGKTSFFSVALHELGHSIGESITIFTILITS